MRCVFIVYNPPNFMEVKSSSDTISVKLPVRSRVFPPSLKCIYMLEKYVHIRGVNPFLAINVNMVD